MVKSFEELDAWRTATELAELVCRTSEQGGLGRDQRLREQIQNTVLSIPSNIAEGFIRKARPADFVAFLYLARSSCWQLRSQLHVVKSLGHIEKIRYEELYQLIKTVSRHINQLTDELKRSSTGDDGTSPER